MIPTIEQYRCLKGHMHRAGWACRCVSPGLFLEVPGPDANGVDPQWLADVHASRADALASAEGAKHTNPKDAIGSGKLPLELVPDSAVALESLAFLEGALKYGRYNWRIAGVRSSIYTAALRRHLAAWWNGEDCDPATGVPHLASVRACAAILIDAKECGKLTDDRPPQAGVGDMQRELSGRVPGIKEQFKDADPYQYTIADG